MSLLLQSTQSASDPVASANYRRLIASPSQAKGNSFNRYLYPTTTPFAIGDIPIDLPVNAG